MPFAVISQDHGNLVAWLCFWILLQAYLLELRFLHCQGFPRAYSLQPRNTVQRLIRRMSLQYNQDDDVTWRASLRGNMSTLTRGVLLLSDPWAAALRSLSLSHFDTVTVPRTSISPLAKMVLALAKWSAYMTRLPQVILWSLVGGFRSFKRTARGNVQLLNNRPDPCFQGSARQCLKPHSSSRPFMGQIAREGRHAGFERLQSAAISRIVWNPRGLKSIPKIRAIPFLRDHSCLLVAAQSSIRKPMPVVPTIRSVRALLVCAKSSVNGEAL